VLQLRVAVAVGAVVALWASWAALSGSQVFEIKRVEVTGLTTLAVDDVTARAGIEEGATLLRLDEAEVVARLLEDPWIADAELVRRWPATLRIAVTEREPAAVVDTGVTFWFVDAGGRVLSESVPSSATVLPVVRDVPDFAAEPGTVSESAILKNALEVLAGLSAELRSSVRTVSAPTINETALLTATGVEIMMGEAVRLEEKSGLVTDIMAAQGNQVVFIDVRSVERPISRGLGE